MTIQTIVDVALLDAGCTFTVQIDGYNEQELQLVRRPFKERQLRLRKASGGRDEGAPLLRLADALAGFLGDVQKGKPYAAPWWDALKPYFTSL